MKLSAWVRPDPFTAARLLSAGMALASGLMCPLAAAQGASTASPLSAAVPEVAPVRVAGGQVVGTVEGGLMVYRGLPYAAPPVGPLRWRPPQPVPAWTGVRHATQFGANCVQPANPRDNGIRPGPSSEDCLTLNVWAPSIPLKAGAPVMVWIHGGSFTGGSGSAALYDGTVLARRGVVVVTLNYRLGLFGFYAHPALSREQAGEPLANYGLMDIAAALRWVQQHIAGLGGDAGNVTIFGESAGGVAVQHLMLSPESRGLFAKAISQSGRGLEQVTLMHKAEQDGQAVAASLGVDAQDGAALRALPADKLVNVPLPSVYDGFGPVLDGQIVRSSVWDGFSRGTQARVPFIVGFNSQELPGAFLGDAVTKLDAGLRWSPDIRAAALAAYGGEAGFKDFAYGDYHYAAAAVRMAQVHARSGAPTFLYRFDFVSGAARARLKGAPHASDRQYVFGTLSSSPWPTSAEDEAVSRAMASLWVGFAATGRPGGSPAWPAFEAGGQLLDIAGAAPAPRPLAEVAPRLLAVPGALRDGVPK